MSEVPQYLMQRREAHSTDLHVLEDEVAGGVAQVSMRRWKLGGRRVPGTYLAPNHQVQLQTNLTPAVEPTCRPACP